MKLDVSSLSFSYGEHPLLSDVSFSISSEKSYALIGKNGSGKSTMFKLLLSMLKGKGEIAIDGRNIESFSARERGCMFSYIPQDTANLSGYTALEVILMGKAGKISLFSHPGKEDEEKAKSIMATLGIERLWNEAIDKISGGERDLVFFSRAVFQDSMFIILDEPTANLDYMNQIMILSRIETLKRQGKGIIFSTHNPEEALQNADEILILDKGKIAFSGSADECIEKNALETLFEGKITVRKIAVDGKERFICIPT